MRGLACVVVALAACQDGGVVIIVEPQPGMGVDQVRLYVGHGDRSETRNLVSAQGAAQDAPYWTRDAHNELDIASPDAVDGAVGFTLVRTDSPKLPVVIAVGFAQGKPVGEAALLDIDLPNDNVFHAYHLGLHGPVSTLAVKSPAELALWSQPGTTQDLTQQACAGVVITAVDPAITAFVVTANDQDCDGIPTGDAKECDPDVYLADRPALANEIDCLAPVNNPTECRFGGPHCVDGVGPMAGCMPANYCAPLPLCSKCNTIPCATDPAQGGSTGVPGYRCDVSIDASGNLCDQTLVLERPPTGGWDCSNATARDADHPFGDKIDVGSFSAEVNFMGGCAVELVVQGKLPANPFTGLVAFDLKNGHGLGLPITFTTEGAGGPCQTVSRSCALDAPAYDAALTACEARWGDPAPVLGLAATDVPMSGPSLTDDELELYFVRPHGLDTAIFVSKRANLASPWGLATVVAELDGVVGDELAPDISPDGLHMFFASDRDTIGQFELFEAKRSSRMDPFSMPVSLGVSATEAAPNGDGSRAILAIAGGGLDLVEVVRDATGSISPGPMMPPEINSTDGEVTPFLSKDGLHLYFASDRFGGADLFVASRNSVDDPFGLPVPLPELSSPGVDAAPWVSRDNHRIYFTSDRVGAVPQIYMATR